MKNIKEINDPKYSDEFGYKQALKDVIELIDEWAEERGISIAKDIKELKSRIEG